MMSSFTTFLLILRLIRNGRSFPHSHLPQLTPERKTGHWLKYPWTNQALLRVDLSW
uniref:Alternative protein TRANK1 n=1 Tax=Homo sapiens TaxID=9606 RepID=L8EAQ6_HUMAN|nr:alternative protein TRANK1 [Homo sapiens]